jgi:hypothetical protein
MPGAAGTARRIFSDGLTRSIEPCLSLKKSLISPAGKPIKEDSHDNPRTPPTRKTHPPTDKRVRGGCFLCGNRHGDQPHSASPANLLKEKTDERRK